jgi:hypothetical protein
LIYRYKINRKNIKEPAERLQIIKGMPGIREIAYHEERDELYCGYKGGKLVVFEIATADKGPIYSL